MRERLGITGVPNSGAPSGEPRVPQAPRTPTLPTRPTRATERGQRAGMPIVEQTPPPHHAGRVLPTVNLPDIQTEELQTKPLLSTSEKSVMVEAALGHRVKESSGNHHGRERAIIDDRVRIFHKLGVHDMSDAIKAGLREKEIMPEEVIGDFNPDLLDKLSPTEKTIWDALADPTRVIVSNGQVVDDAHVTNTTINTHMSRMARKLRTTNRPRTTAVAVAWNMLNQKEQDTNNTMLQ